MTDIGGLGSLGVYLSTNAFKVQAMSPGVAGAPLPAEGGALTLSGLGGEPLTISIYSLGVLNSPGYVPQVWAVSGFVTATLEVTRFWTYDGLYDAESGAWVG